MLRTCIRLLRGSCLLGGWLFITFAAFTICASASDNEPASKRISPEQAISVIKALEGKIKVLHWKSHFTRAGLKDGDEPDSITTEQLPNVKADVLLDTIARRYLCHTEGTYEWVDGPDSKGSSVEERSYDGESYQHWFRAVAGEETPAEDDVQARGIISKDRADISDRDYLESNCLALGWAYVPPYFWNGGGPPSPLSALMEKWIDEGRKVSIVAEDESTWKFVVPWKHPEEFGTLYMSYSLDKGGIVEEARWENIRGFDTVRLQVEVAKAAGGEWVPQTVQMVRVLDRYLDRIAYETVEVNPTIDGEPFACEFPDGCKVENFAEEVTYVVGSTEDLQSQIRQFALENNITGDVKPSSVWMPRAVLLLLGVCLCLALTVVYLARKRQSP